MYNISSPPPRHGQEPGHQGFLRENTAQFNAPIRLAPHSHKEVSGLWGQQRYGMRHTTGTALGATQSDSSGIEFHHELCPSRQDRQFIERFPREKFASFTEASRRFQDEAPGALMFYITDISEVDNEHVAYYIPKAYAKEVLLQEPLTYNTCIAPEAAGAITIWVFKRV